MVRPILLASAALLLLSIATAPVAAQANAKPAQKAEQMAATTVGDLKWSDLKVPGFDPGAQMAVLDGNPNGVGGVYTLRLKFPAGYRFPAHWHPKTEHLTVLSGSFQLG